MIEHRFKTELIVYDTSRTDDKVYFMCYKYRNSFSFSGNGIWRANI